MSDSQTTAPGSLLYYLAAMLFLALDMHHWMLVGFQKTYSYLPIGGGHLSEMLLSDIIARTSQTFLLALQMSAPIVAVSFIISLVLFRAWSRCAANERFAESFTIRTLAGLTVFGLTMQLMSQHITNYLRRLPEDFLRVAQLLGAG